MAQYGRPSIDTTNESYTDQASGTATIYTMIDEVVADDADYIRSAVAPTNDVYVTKLTSVEDPQSSTGHIVRYRYGKDTTGGAQIDLTMQLRQTYVSEGTLGTLIHSEPLTNIVSGWTAGSFTLTAPEADAIGNYGDLYIRVVSNQV